MSKKGRARGERPCPQVRVYGQERGVSSSERVFLVGRGKSRLYGFFAGRGTPRHYGFAFVLPQVFYVMLCTVNFAEKLHTRILEKNTRLCLGLDPRLEWHGSNLDIVEAHCLDVLERCAEFVACVKPNVAYYEAMGVEGMAMLERLCAAARVMGVPVILDAKRGDFPSTAEAYAKAWLMGVHAGSGLTMNPFLGFETIETFLTAARNHDGAVFVLVKTSNPGSKDIQDLETKHGTVAEVIAAHLAIQAQNGYGAVGAVVGATHATELEAWRKRLLNVVLLLPGLGAQGAKASDLAAAFDSNGLGAVASASRGIQYASRGADYAVAAREAAKALRDELNLALA